MIILPKMLTERSVIMAILPIMLEIEYYLVIFQGTFEVLSFSQNKLFEIHPVNWDAAFS